MFLKSTDARYGTVAITIHWASAFLILALILSGFRAAGMADADGKAAILAVHIPLGISILLLTLARLAWWTFADRKPKPMAMPRWQDRASRAVHMLFYVVILGTAASGIGTLALSGAAAVIFDGAATPLPNFNDFAPRDPHRFGARLMLALFILHAGAALHHHFIQRDRLLARMWFRKA